MNLERIYRKTHIQTFNPPYAHGGMERKDDPHGWIKTAYTFTMDGSPGDFIIWIEQQFPRWRESALGHHLVGRAYKYEGQFSQARAHLEEARQMRQNEPIHLAETLVVLSEVAIDEGDTQEAWRLLDEAVVHAPHHRSPHINRFCLASLAEDEQLLKELFASMQQVYPDWHRDEKLCNGLHTDGELGFLREESEVWDQMLAQMDFPQ